MHHKRANIRCQYERVGAPDLGECKQRIPHRRGSNILKSHLRETTTPHQPGPITHTWEQGCVKRVKKANTVGEKDLPSKDNERDEDAGCGDGSELETRIIEL